MLRTIATLATPALLVGAFAFGAATLVGRDPAPTSWVNWGGESFSSPKQLRRWLRAHGLSYRAWSANHPHAAARIEGREPRPARMSAPAPRRQPQSRMPAAQASSASEAPAARAGPGISLGNRLVLLALVAAGAALIAVAAMPVPVLRAINAPELVYEHRLELISAGVAIAIGIAAAHVLSSTQP